MRWTFRSFVRARRETSILDVGCGAGRHAVFLAREGFQVSACDFSAPGLREMEARAAQEGLRIESVQASADDLSGFGDGAFDGVVCFGVLYYLDLEGARKAVAEAHRVLRPCGKYLCVVRSVSDSRCLSAQRVGDCCWHIRSMREGAPSDMEAGMNMLFFDRADIDRLFGGFRSVTAARMTYSEDGFTDDDWVVLALR